MSNNNKATREYKTILKRQYVPPGIDLDEMPEKQFGVLRRVSCSYVCRRESDRGREVRFETIESAQGAQNEHSRQPNTRNHPTLTMAKKTAARIERINRQLEKQGLPENPTPKRIIKVPAHALVMLSQSIRTLNPADIFETLIGNGKNSRVSQFSAL